MKVAIIDGIAAHYRLSLFQKLCRLREPEYSIFASKKNHNGIVAIDKAFASMEISKGGLNWTFIDNVVICKRIMWQRGVIGIVYKGSFDVFIFPGEFHILSTWISVVICRLRKKKVVFWGHGSYGNEKFLKKYLRKVFNKLPDAYLLYNDWAKQLLIKEGVCEDKLFLINNSLDYDSHVNIRNTLDVSLIDELRRKLFNLNPDYPVILFIGRLTTEKHIEQLILSIGILNQYGTKVNCVIVGSGEQEMELKELAHKEKLDRYINFYGPSYNESENGQLLTMADCSVSPGNVGLNAIHSMSFGTPVITHNDLNNQGPEVSSIIEGLTGELFERNNIDNMVEKIQTLIFVNGKNHYSENCKRIVDDLYNPYYQLKVFDSLIQFITSKY